MTTVSQLIRKPRKITKDKPKTPALRVRQNTLRRKKKEESDNNSESDDSKKKKRRKKRK